MHLFFFLQKISDEPKLIQTENSSNERFVSLDFFFQIRLKNLNDNNSNTYDQKESFPSKVELDRFQIWIKILTNSNDGFRVQKKNILSNQKKMLLLLCRFWLGNQSKFGFFFCELNFSWVEKNADVCFSLQSEFSLVEFPKNHTEREDKKMLLSATRSCLVLITNQQ